MLYLATFKKNLFLKKYAVDKGGSKLYKEGLNNADVVQLVRASDCGSECRGFESHLPPAKKRKFERIFLFFCYCPNNPPKGGNVESM